jgi:hypothetical protein
MLPLDWLTSLARPGGNITGLTDIAAVLAGKQLELLKETVPKLFRVAVLWEIRESVRELLGQRMDQHARDFAPTHDPKIVDELSRLSTERGKLAEQWNSSHVKW